MTTTRSSLESLHEIYPVLASLPSPRFTGPFNDVGTTNADMKKESTQHASSTGPPSRPPSVLPTLAYITPPLCILYAVLLGHFYGCPFITRSFQTIAAVTSLSADGLLAAALLLSSVGLITLGVGFLWPGELQAGDERI